MVSTYVINNSIAAFLAHCYFFSCCLFLAATLTFLGFLTCLPPLSCLVAFDGAWASVDALDCVKFEFSMNRFARDGMKTFFDTMQITKRMSIVCVLENDDILAPIDVSK